MLTAATLPCLALLLGANPYLDEGRRLFEAMRYRPAEQQLRLARDVSANTRAERRESSDLLARSLIALGRVEDAERVYSELLVSDAGAPGPKDAAPKIVAVFLAAKQRLYPSDYVRLVERAAPPDRVSLELVDPWRRVASVVVVEGGGERPLRLEEDRLAADVTGPWSVEARDTSGVAVAAIRSAAAEPGRALAPPPAPAAAMGVEPAIAIAPQPPLRPRWVPWTLTGLAVAAAGTGAALGLLSYRDYRAAGAAPFASQTQALDRQAQAKAIAANALIGGALLPGAVAVVLFLTW